MDKFGNFTESDYYKDLYRLNYIKYFENGGDSVDNAIKVCLGKLAEIYKKKSAKYAEAHKEVHRLKRRIK